LNRNDRGVLVSLFCHLLFLISFSLSSTKTVHFVTTIEKQLTRRKQVIMSDNGKKDDKGDSLDAIKAAARAFALSETAGNLKTKSKTKNAVKKLPLTGRPPSGPLKSRDRSLLLPLAARETTPPKLAPATANSIYGASHVYHSPSSALSNSRARSLPLHPSKTIAPKPAVATAHSLSPAPQVYHSDHMSPLTGGLRATTSFLVPARLVAASNKAAIPRTLASDDAANHPLPLPLTVPADANSNTMQIPSPPLPPALSPRSYTTTTEDLDDYEIFVKSLGLESGAQNTDDQLLTNLALLPDDDDDDEFQFDADEADDDEDASSIPRTQGEAESDSAMALDELLLDADDPFFDRIEDELGWLEEEDMAAAVATLLDHPSKDNQGEMEYDCVKGNDRNEGTPLRGVTSASLPEVSDKQLQQFSFLIERHYQLLMQQAVLAARKAHSQRDKKADSNLSADGWRTETCEELAAILDGGKSAWRVHVELFLHLHSTQFSFCSRGYAPGP
jgi:hypothetical protein